MVRQPQEDSSQLRPRRDLWRLLLRDWSPHQALRVDLLRQVVLPRQVLPAVAAAVAAPAASSSQVVAVPAHRVAVPRLQDWSAPGHPDSCLQLQAALVPEAELVRAKPMRTRVNRDRW